MHTNRVVSEKKRACHVYSRDESPGDRQAGKVCGERRAEKRHSGAFIFHSAWGIRGVCSPVW
ncbi:hypothetical protein ABTH94_21780, partial [Acinetobacter baumannii]